MKPIFKRTEEPTAAEKAKGAEVVFIYTVNGEEVKVYAATCYESFEQWGAPVEVLAENVDRVEAWRAGQPEEEETEEQENTYAIDWKNVNLNDGYTRDQNILDPISFADLLLNIECNVTDITPESVADEFKTALNRSVEQALEIFKDNHRNIYLHALRNQ